MFYRILVCLLVVLLAGCGKPNASSKSNGKNKKPAKAKTPVAANQPPKFVLDPNAYSSVEEAVASLAEAAEKGDSDTRLQASGWLKAKKDAAVAPLGKLLNDKSQGLATKIAVCKVLGQLGPAASPILIAQVDSDEELVRLNAAEQLAIVKPTSKQNVQTLIGLLKGEDDRLRVQALKGLAHIGPPAEESVPKLLAILNSNDNETVRDAAKAALKSVNPRHTFLD